MVIFLPVLIAILFCILPFIIYRPYRIVYDAYYNRFKILERDWWTSKTIVSYPTYEEALYKLNEIKVNTRLAEQNRKNIPAPAKEK